MGVEHGKPQQFFMPDKGTGRPGREKREEREIEKILLEMKEGKPLNTNVLSSEPKVDPSSPLPKPISPELKGIASSIEKKSRQRKKIGN